jgi:hypothetical protein
MFLNSYRRRLRSEALMRGVVSRVDQTYVAPFLGAKVIREEDWRAVFTTARSEERICGWSPDSRLLYFLLERDGFRCLYALRLDPRTGLAEGDMFEVQHFHDPSREWGSTGYSSAVVNGLFLFNQVGLTGNIWQLR